MRSSSFLLVALCVGLISAASADDLPTSLSVVLEQTSPLRSQPRGRLPLYVLPITGTLAGISDANVESIDWQLADGGHVTVPAEPGNHVLEVQTTHRTTHRTGHRSGGQLEINGVTRFPIGSYELPADEDALRMMAQRGINIVRCTSRDDLDRAQAAGVAGWVPLNIQMKYVRGFIDEIDVTGCDYYAVRSEGTDLQSAGRLVDRWSAIGRGKPVWMVLQGFSWHTAHPTRTRLYPSFIQSRLMAYDAIVHGARGIFYWGTWTIDDPAFRRSLYALTAELAKLEPFLVAADGEAVQVRVVDDLFDPPERNVRATLRRDRDDGLLILVNEDAHRHLGVEITGLDALEGHELKVLYGTETVRVRRGEIVTRLQGFEVKVFSTDRTLESPNRAGRDYKDGPSSGDDSPHEDNH